MPTCICAFIRDESASSLASLRASSATPPSRRISSWYCVTCSTASVSFRQHPPAYVSIRRAESRAGIATPARAQPSRPCWRSLIALLLPLPRPKHTSAYVSMSAYVRIRPHTSAYVSIRQKPESLAASFAIAAPSASVFVRLY